MSGRVVLDTKEVDRICKVLNVNRDAIIRRAAFQIEAEAKKNAPYDTTALKNSIYTVTGDHNGYHQAATSAKAKNPDVQTEAFPTPAKGSAHVGACVEYAEYVEYPGAVRKGGERPYLTPAAELIANRYNEGKEWEELIK
jgi:hypothetical protein